MSTPVDKPSQIEQLTEKVVAAERELNVFLAEQEAYDGELHDAAYAGDAAKLLNLQRRRDDLPAYIQGAQVTLLKAQIARLEALAVEDQDEVKPLAEAQAAAKEALDKAQRVYNEAFNRYANARNQVRSGQSDLAARKRALADLLREMGQDSGPVVRSRVGTLLRR